MHVNVFLTVLTNMPHLRRLFLGRFQCYRYYMPTAFKKDFMPLAFNPDGVFSPWQVSPPATENIPNTLFFLNLMTMPVGV
jgi:hypothetical protein